MIRKTAIVPPLLLSLMACRNTVGDENHCETVALPLQGSASGPVVIDVGLEVQPSGIVVVATATDPGGSANLAGVTQSVGVYPDPQCRGVAIVLQDDLAGSGVEETFGMAVDASVNASLYNSIASATTWPVSVDFRDADGNRTMGRVLAPVR